MKQFVLFTVIFTLFFVSCKKTTSSVLTAQDIIDKTIEISGGELFDVSKIAFDFRDMHYVAQRDHGEFSLERHFKDSIFNVKDVLDNNGFNRFVENEPLELIDSMAVKYAASVNSVHYFSVLPYGLNDEAVNKELLGEEVLKDKTYYKIEVTFKQDGGGEDFEDVFIYWVQKDSFKMDYLAYSFHEENGLGYRFREAYNERYIHGVRFVDYRNYKPKTKGVSLRELGHLYESNDLELLSKIELKNVTVN
ncbi:deoxyribose-phosphate aldolase [Xanthomarina sp. F1114]|uniref:DUF6503 family protein n=1 Tax=Xanthomarina sp. F1114 TaxID=2996019 RepID=UPI00225DD02C|nr:DUF6503 family protein [Xanthomarina sp. F1114]MCX7547698.1 deoxyribose-phosphate aldolase [Xanthomarina sp. F1114]